MSEKSKIVSIPRETVEKYIEGYYKPQYRIEETIQANFWEAVCLLCQDTSADVSTLIDLSETTAAQFCVDLREETEKVIQLAKNIANEIRENETADIDLIRADIFLMKKKMEKWEEKLKKISLLF